LKKEDKSVGVLSGGGGTEEDTPVARLLSDCTSTTFGFVSDKATSSIVGVAALSSVTSLLGNIVVLLVVSIVACGSSSSSSNSISTSLTTMMFLFLALRAFFTRGGKVKGDGGKRVIGCGMA
jgi:hypothetical protein